MVSVISGKRQLENRKCSLTSSSPRYKMQKVSVVRDFPLGCGPTADVPSKEVEVGGLKSVDLPENGDGSHVVEGKGFLRDMVECHPHEAVVSSDSSGKATSSLVNHKNMESVSDGLPRWHVDLKSNGLAAELIASNPKSSENLTKKIEESTSTDEFLDTSKDSVELRDESLSASKNVGMNIKKAVVDSKSKIPLDARLPLRLEGRKWKHPLQVGVSALRHFPSGCRHNVKLSEAEDKLLVQDEGVANTLKELVRDDDNQIVDFDDTAYLDKIKRVTSGNVEAKNEVQSDGGTRGVIIVPVPQHEERCEMEQEQVSEAMGNEQHQGSKAYYDGKGDKDSRNGLEKEIVLYRNVNRKKTPIVVSISNTESEQETMSCLQSKEDRVIVLCLMPTPDCPWKQGREAAKSNPSSTDVKRNKRKKRDYAGRDEFKLSPDKRKVTTTNLGEAFAAVTPYLNDTNKFSSMSKCDEELSNDSILVPRKCDFDVNPPPCGAVSSSEMGVRGKVRATLRLFHAIVRKLQQGHDTKAKKKEKLSKRIDFHAAEILKNHGKYLNTSKNSMRGPVPGIEVGDIFKFRIELAIVGLHRPLQSGIDYLNLGHKTIATSIVASGGYANDVYSSDVLIYTGQGGNAIGNKEPEDQKLERGNLALMNSIVEKNEVRVIRGFKEKKHADTVHGRPKAITTYTYDGLFTVEKYWREPGPNKKLVFKFELRRLPDQPELSWKEVTRSKKFTVRKGRCADDISGGREAVPICAINTVDDERPPPFTYITSMMYPDWCQPIPSIGCDCKDGCSDSERCECAVKNGGEIPYNCDGQIVEAKPLVYECGPSCKCPPTCQNRVSQNGVKFPLEVFKTESRGWGVRCLSSIPSGSFISEYIGELLDDREAEQRTGSDEYLFDVGQNKNDPTLLEGLSGLMPEGPTSSVDVVEDVGFTIDAADYGNIGRFINHSCSPNLYAQNVLYDHEDKRIPHIMLFAADNIPPLQELAYDYNYAIDQVLDSDGNIKKKSCYCGSSECTGRMY